MNTSDRPPTDGEPTRNATHHAAPAGNARDDVEPLLRMVAPGARRGVAGKGNAAAAHYANVRPRQSIQRAILRTVACIGKFDL